MEIRRGLQYWKVIANAPTHPFRRLIDTEHPAVGHCDDTLKDRYEEISVYLYIVT
jgi:hypothetical protein